MAAITAKNISGSAAAVEEEDGLLAALQRGLKFLSRSRQKIPR